MSFIVEVTNAYREASDAIIELIVAMPATNNFVLSELTIFFIHNDIWLHFFSQLFLYLKISTWNVLILRLRGIVETEIRTVAVFCLDNRKVGATNWTVAKDVAINVPVIRFPRIVFSIILVKVITYWRGTLFPFVSTTNGICCLRARVSLFRQYIYFRTKVFRIKISARHNILLI